MKKWKVWPSPPSHHRDFRLHLVVHGVDGLPAYAFRDVIDRGLVVHLEWRGRRRRMAGVSLGAIESNCTSKRSLQSDGTASWNEEFCRACKLKMADDGRSFASWIIGVEIHGFGLNSNGKVSVLGKIQLDISKYASQEKETRQIRIPINCNITGHTAEVGLWVTLKLLDLRIMDSSSTASTLKRATSLRFFTSWRGQDPKTKRDSPVDSSSEEDPAPNSAPSLLRLLSRNRGGKINGSRSARYSNERPLMNRIYGEVNATAAAQSVTQTSTSTSSSSQEEAVPFGEKNNSQTLKLEDDDGRFEIGSWEKKTVVSRDGRMELSAEVFLASIDQRSETAAGNSACSVLVAVIADWLHRNRKTLPMRCQFDELVQEGSSEWRRLCADERHREEFSDQHFDLDTVLAAGVRPLAVVTEMSYVGFFGLEGVFPEGVEYLQGAMSFDGIWEELRRVTAEENEERVYIASWNDHFFLLKVESDVIYLIDTLGERLFEGCDQAYILKFDRESRIGFREVEAEEGSAAAAGETIPVVVAGGELEAKESSSREVLLLCEGVDSCKEYIKGFLAALPLREVQQEMEKGSSIGKGHLQRRLQIEFHYTSPL